MHDENHPELTGYEPDDERPLRNPMLQRVIRVIVVIGILGLILPGIVISIATAANTAEVACQSVISQKAPDAEPDARFDLLGVAGPGWYCYALQGGEEVLVQGLGLIPQAQWAPTDDGDPA